MLAYVAYRCSMIVQVVVRLYPTYFCHRERMKVSLTVERRIFQRVLSVRLYSLKNVETV